MRRKELTKTFMMLSNPLVSIVYAQIFQRSNITVNRSIHVTTLSEHRSSFVVI